MENQITPRTRRLLAAQVGISEQYLYQCLTGRRDMDPVEARRLEVATAGVLKRQMLCQKRWRGIWPELAANSDQKHTAALDGQAFGAIAVGGV